MADRVEYQVVKIYPAEHWPSDRDKLVVIATFPTAKLAARAEKELWKRWWCRQPLPRWRPSAIKHTYSEMGGWYIDLPRIPSYNTGRVDLELDQF